MRSILTALGATLCFACVAPAVSQAQESGYGKRTTKVHTRTAVRPTYRRPASVASNGLCQRDTGTPTSQLNFRNQCDTEEFWARTLQGSRRF